MTVLRTLPTLATPRTVVSPSPGISLVRYICQRFRTSLILSLAAALFAALLLAFPFLQGPGPWLTGIRILLAISAGLGLLLSLFVAFCFADQEIGAAASSYPQHLLRLPVSSAILAYVPFLLGSLTLVLGWFFVNRFLLHPIGVEVAYPIPAAVMVASFALTQTVTWMPLPIPHLRGILLLLLWLTNIVVTAVAVLNGALEPVVISVLLLVATGAAHLSRVGVTHARQGRIPGEAGWGRFIKHFSLSRTAGKEPRELPVFATPFAAQFWAEFVRNGYGTPLALAIFYGFMTIAFLISRDRAAVSFPGNLTVNGGAWVQIGPLLFALMAMMMPAMLGCGVQKRDTRNQDLTIPLFLATRPITSAALIGVKLAVALVMAVLSWAVNLGFALIWSLFLTASDDSGSGPLLFVLLRHTTPGMVASAVTLLLALVLATWKSQTDSLFADVTRHGWLMNGYPFLSACILAVPIAVSIVLRSQEWGSVDGALLAMPFLAGSAVALKLIVGGYLVVQFYRQRALSLRQWGSICAGWLTIAFGLPLLLQATLTAALPVPAGYLFAGVILFCLPLARLSLAPLELEANRRRR